VGGQHIFIVVRQLGIPGNRKSTARAHVALFDDGYRPVDNHQRVSQCECTAGEHKDVHHHRRGADGAGIEEGVRRTATRPIRPAATVAGRQEVAARAQERAPAAWPQERVAARTRPQERALGVAQAQGRVAFRPCLDAAGL
jgi:hypothetical protein